MVYDIYCDESRQDLLASRTSITEYNWFCCIGGIIIENESRELLKQKIKQLKEKHRVYGELKWGTVSDNKYPFYEELVKLFFDFEGAHFRTVVIDARKVDHSYNDNSQELGYYKFYYQLLYHWISSRDSYWVFTDQKTNGDKRRLQELKRTLNNSFKGATPINDIQAISSKESIIMQMQNVLMGAVAYKYNFGDHGASEAKNRIVRLIEDELGRPIRKTYPSERKFNIFEIELREGR